MVGKRNERFVYTQILHQGETTTADRIVSDTVVVEQIPKLMRAIGYYVTNKEVYLYSIKHTHISKVRF